MFRNIEQIDTENTIYPRRVFPYDIFKIQSALGYKMNHCDLETGVCSVATDHLANTNEIETKQVEGSIYYIGDPMCSWCWGISPAIEELEGYAKQHHIDFDIVVGGLRAGGGDAWDERFKTFLRREWQHIASVTGQPFGYSLLDKPQFDYDTEPACRAITVIKHMVHHQLLPDSTVRKAFALIQRKFYLQGDDPKLEAFYESICLSLDIDYPTFLDYFTDEQFKTKVIEEFRFCRQIGVSSFPTVCAVRNNQLTVIAQGYSSFELMKKKVMTLFELDNKN